MTRPKVMRRVMRREGAAMMLGILLLLVMGAVVTGALATSSTTIVVNRMHQRESLLESAALEGIERVRATLNSNPSLYPDSGWVTLEDDVEVTVGESPAYRSLHVGPSGIISGEYGIFGTIVSEVRDAGGAIVIRRSQLFQESFAKFAYFTDIEPSNIYFGGGDQIFGPLHTNDILKVHSTGATFHSDVRTAQHVSGGAYGDFRQGYQEDAPEIPLPETQELDKLRHQAQAGGTYFQAPVGAGPHLRIDFVARDLNGDGAVTGGDEGFIRVYRSNNAVWLNARIPSDGMRNSDNCGHTHADGTFVAADAHSTNGSHNWLNSLTTATRRCFLGGAPELFGGFHADDGIGTWDLAPAGPYPVAQGQPDAAYLVPITRAGNPSFKGVIFVDGNVTVSGTLRGRVTVAATGNIHIGDDLVYSTDPGLGTCEDIMGLFAASDVVVEDNTLNSPIQPQGSGTWYTYDDTRDEFIHGIILALDQFTVEDYNGGSTSAQACEQSQWGRGCLYLSGGVIQRTRGAVGTTAGTGYLKRYSYDTCGATAPPPYFPTTGHFVRGALYEVDPANFDLEEFFDLMGS